VPPQPQAKANAAEAHVHAYTDGVYVPGHGSNIQEAVPQYGGTSPNTASASHVWGLRE
jgi:hypothetical protein